MATTAIEMGTQRYPNRSEASEQRKTSLAAFVAELEWICQLLLIVAVVAVFASGATAVNAPSIV